MTRDQTAEAQRLARKRKGKSIGSDDCLSEPDFRVGSICDKRAERLAFALRFGSDIGFPVVVSRTPFRIPPAGPYWLHGFYEEHGFSS